MIMEDNMILDANKKGVITTENSIWTFDGKGKYCRSPRDVSAARGITPSEDDSLLDGNWVEFSIAKFVADLRAPGKFRLSIIPSSRAEGSFGIRTGVIVSADFE
jgi:hypothetical protein